jgi:predicted RND superfamily exporter protein
MINFFKTDSSVFKDYTRMNTRMNGTGVVGVLIESPNKGDIVDSRFIEKMDRFSSYLKENNPSVTSVQSLSQYIKQMNKVMNFDSIPYASNNTEEVSIDFFSDTGTGTPFGVSEKSPRLKDSKGFVFADENSLVSDSSNNTGIEAGLSYTEVADLLKEALLNTENQDPSAEELIQGFNKINNYAGAAYYEIPQDPAKYGLKTEKELNALISQYLILAAGNLGTVINDDLEPDKTLITIQLNDENKASLSNVLTDVHQFWDREIPSGWSYGVGGSSTIYYILDKLIINSQILSILGSLFLVWLIITLIFRSVKVGFIGLLPIISSVSGLLIAFVALGLTLDAVTSLTAAIAIGVGADYAIHVLVAYRRLALKMDRKEIILSLYNTTGRAIFLNAFSVAIGFFALVLSHLIPMGVFGSMFALSMVISSMASLILIPAILNKMDVGKLFKQKEENKYKIVKILD